MALKNITYLTVGIGIGLGFNLIKPQQTQKLNESNFPNLGKGLLETPGCLDVKTGRLGQAGQQQTIFAWFKDKKAVQDWYDSPMHVAAMKKFFPNMPGSGSVLPKHKDTDGPWLVVASITPGDKPILKDSPLHLSQIAIEIYSPVSGGIAIGGSFGPKSLGTNGPAWISNEH